MNAYEYCPVPTRWVCKNPMPWSPSDKAVGVLAGLKAAFGCREIQPAYVVMEAIAAACRDADLSDKECDWLYEEL